MTQSLAQNQDLDLAEVIDDLLLVLNQKERMVITKRYSLDNKPRETLEMIGNRFNVTRERIRQIEASALKKLQRNVHNSALESVSRYIEEYLQVRGGLSLEEQLVSSIIVEMEMTDNALTGQIVRLVLAITPNTARSDSTRLFRRFWYLQDMVTMSEIRRVANTSYKVLKQHGDTRHIDEHITLTLDATDLMSQASFVVRSILEVDSRLRIMKNKQVGLQEWRHVNPRSIHDKALLILKERNEPMHFIEIANAIIDAEFDTKRVTVQAVHNDLIRYSDFVLVGRGIYGLSEWGFTTGTVADVIAEYLRDNGPATKQDIVSHVQESRSVKIGTISLNLQKEQAFVRVGRAVYDFDPAAWNPKTNGRGRKHKSLSIAQKQKQLKKRGPRKQAEDISRESAE